jgi:hypothetical protein
LIDKYAFQKISIAAVLQATIAKAGILREAETAAQL